MRLIQNGDTIRAVIRATGTNQDGQTPGLTQPSSQAQEAMIRRTYQDGGISLATTRFFEAHGTGTALGDPTEARAIYRAFQQYRSKSKPLYVGAAKTNIGDLEGASDIAGLIKPILVLEKGIIPLNIWFEKPNPLIPSDERNLPFPLTPIPWPTSGLRRASVSSFGLGGANAHAVLDDAFNYLRLRNLQGRHKAPISPPPDRGQAEFKHCSRLDHSVHTRQVFNKRPKPHLLVWSASDEDGLRRWELAYQECFKDWLVENEDDLLQDLVHTLYKRRSLLPWRSYTIASSFEELSSATRISPPVRSTDSPALAFICTGQGAQWRNMGQGLLEYPVYRDSLVAADNYFSELGCQWSLLGKI
ncbi:MAG: hypothetical protein L6R36_008113 [Xanthoria steineri]|nr:MAG: hypothetical protein L6R36_008113 [Xanthoria steineri]